MSRSIMIASGKGGTGKSTVTVNLGLSIALSGKKVVLLDMNTGLRTLDLYLGLENRALFDIGDLVNGICGMENAILGTDVSDNLKLLPGSQKYICDELDEEHLGALIDSLKEEYDYILMDCPPGIGRMVEVCAACADEAIIVTNADYAALRDADALEDKLIRSGIWTRHYILNGLAIDLVEKSAAVDLEDIDSRFRCTMLGIIMYDFNIKASTNQGVPITIKRDTYISKNYDRIAARLLNEEQNDEDC